MKRHYLLTIDGPLLRNQRQLLLKLLDAAPAKRPFVLKAIMIMTF